MSHDVEASYAHCARIARRSASNFYYAFLLLPAAKRRSMCALYAFLRRTDDVGDSEAPVEQRRAALDEWRTSLDRALAGQFDDPALPALADTLERWQIPVRHLHAVLDGVEMDLAGRHYATFDDLADYCRHVASAVGLACLPIWECRGAEAEAAAVDCGIACQLTNVLRDVKEDLAGGRVYLPAEDLARFDYTVDDLRREVRDERFAALMEFEIARAESFYERGARLARDLPPDAQGVFAAIMETYRTLLDEIRRRRGDVFSGRVRLGRARRLAIAGRAFLRLPSLFALARRSAAS